MLPRGVLAAAGGILVQVLCLLPAVPGSSFPAPGLAREPLHQHGVPAKEGEAGWWRDSLNKFLQRIWEAQGLSPHLSGFHILPRALLLG